MKKSFISFVLVVSFVICIIRSGVVVKHGIEFRHSTRNASRSRRKMLNGVS